MFKVVVLDGKEKLPEDDIYYIIAKGGVFLRKKLGLIESITPVTEISILEDIQSYAKMSIPKIPGKSVAKVMTFFKKAYELYKSEAVVLLYYNTEKKSYKVYVPHQKVSGASVDYTKGISLANHIQIGTIHSHANFSAFHSGVDDHDEEHFDGLHITIGNNNDEFPSFSASVVVNGKRFPVPATEYIDGLEMVEYTPYFPQMFRPAFTEINGVKEYKNNVQSKLAYKLCVTLEPGEFNEKWLERIEDNRPVYVQPTYDQFGYGSYGRHWFGESYQNAFGTNLSDDGPLQRFRDKFSKKNKKNKNKFKEESRFVIPEKPKYDPCASCIFKNYKSKEESVVVNKVDPTDTAIPKWNEVKKDNIVKINVVDTEDYLG